MADHVYVKRLGTTYYIETNYNIIQIVHLNQSTNYVQKFQTPVEVDFGFWDMNYEGLFRDGM